MSKRTTSAMVVGFSIDRVTECIRLPLHVEMLVQYVFAAIHSLGCFPPSRAVADRER